MSTTGRRPCPGCAPGSATGAPRHVHAPAWLQRGAGLVGVGGSVACAVAMILPVVGLVGAAGAAGAHAAAGMAGMAGMAGNSSSPSTHTGLEGFLLNYGEEVTVVSVLLVSASLGMRRLTGGIAALIAGAILFVGMYAQASNTVMYATIGIAFGIWAGGYFWAIRPPRSSR